MPISAIFFGLASFVAAMASFLIFTSAKSAAIDRAHHRTISAMLNDPATWDAFFACMEARGWRPR